MFDDIRKGGSLVEKLRFDFILFIYSFMLILFFLAVF